MVLKVANTQAGGGGGSGTVTSISGTAGQINTSPSPITATGVVSLANTAVTAGTYGNATTVAKVIIDAQGRVTNAVNVAIQISNNAVTGLGTMATQNSNAISVTGGSINGTVIGNSNPGDGTFGILTADQSRANTFVASGNISGSNQSGAYSYGTLSYADTGIVASYANSANSAVQIVLQNTSNGINASSDYVVVNDTASAYADFGINSSLFSGAGAFYKPSAPYLYAGSADLYVGTITANAIHFVANNATTDAITIAANNAVTIANLTATNVTIVSGSANLTTFKSTSNTAANATFGSATMMLIPAGYIIANVNSVNVKIPYYAV